MFFVGMAANGEEIVKTNLVVTMSESRTAWNHTAWESHVIRGFALASWPPQPYKCSVLRSHRSLALNVPRTPKESNNPSPTCLSLYFRSSQALLVSILGNYRSYRFVPISAVSRLPTLSAAPLTHDVPNRSEKRKSEIAKASPV